MARNLPTALRSFLYATACAAAGASCSAGPSAAAQGSRPAASAPSPLPAAASPSPRAAAGEPRDGAASPGTYWLDGACATAVRRDEEVRGETGWIWCVEAVVVRETGEMEFRCSWRLATPYELQKGPDHGNRNMYLVDGMGRRLDHIETTDAARFGGPVARDLPATGAFVFPASGASVFTFHDDDQHVAIRDIRLEPERRTTKERSTTVLGRILEATELEVQVEWHGLGPSSSTRQVLRPARTSGGGPGAVPEATFAAALRVLAESPLVPGPYVPRFEHTDDYPSASLRATAGGETFHFHSESQGAGRVPWAAEVGGTTYVVPSDTPARALAMLEPFLPAEGRRPRSYAAPPDPPAPPDSPARKDELRLAAQQGDAAAVERLLAAGADPDERTAYDGGTALTAAVLGRHSEAVRALLRGGADPSIATPEGDALAIAVAVGDETIVGLILDARKGTRRLRGAAGRPLLRAAAVRGSAGILKRLAAAGAELDGAEAEGETALEIAAGNGHLEATRALLALGARARKALALGRAARNGYPEVVRALLAAGAPPNGSGRGEWPPIMGVLAPDTLRLLLSAGADPRVKDASGRTPLLFACSSLAGRHFVGAPAGGATPSDRVAAVRLLLEAGASPGEVDARGHTPLMWAAAARAGRPDVALMRVLIEAGAEVNARDSRRRTALFYAATSENPGERAVGGSWDVEAVRLLLASGADPRLVDAEAGSVLDLVRRERDRSAREVEGVLLAALRPHTR